MHIQKFCILLALLLFVMIGTAAAHSPSRLQLAYSEQTGEVVMTGTHAVDDPATHFIGKAEIRKNGETVISETYTGQASKDTFTYRYLLPLSAGDEIVATAACNIGGSATARFIMPGPTATAPQAPGSTPLWVYHAILMVTGLLCILVAGLIPVYGKGIAGWYRLHILTGVIGSLLVIPAIFLVFRATYLAVNPSAFTVHVILGLLLLFSLLVALLLAIIRGHAGSHKGVIRSAHLWAGRAFIVLVVVNILTGLAAVGIL